MSRKFKKNKVKLLVENNTPLCVRQIVIFLNKFIFTVLLKTQVQDLTFFKVRNNVEIKCNRRLIFKDINNIFSKKMISFEERPRLLNLINPKYNKYNVYF